MPFFTKNDQIYAKRLKKYVKSKRNLKVENYPQFLIQENRRTLIKEINFYFKIIKEIEFKSYNFQRLFYNRECKKFRNQKCLKICTKERFKKSFNKLWDKNRNEAIFLYILLLSGRRGQDLVRLTSNNVTALGNLKYSCSIPFDKRSQDSKEFIVDFAEDWSFWLPENIIAQEILNEWDRLIENSDSLFDKIKKGWLLDINSIYI